MKKLGIYIFIVLVITIILPTVIVKTFNFVPRDIPSLGVSLVEERPEEEEEEDKKDPVEIEYDFEKVKVYNPRNKYSGYSSYR